MEMDTYTAKKLVDIRLAEARAASAREALISAARPAGRGLLAGIGLALIKIGRRFRRRGPARRRATRIPDLSPTR